MHSSRIMNDRASKFRGRHEQSDGLGDLLDEGRESERKGVEPASCFHWFILGFEDSQPITMRNVKVTELTRFTSRNSVGLFELANINNIVSLKPLHYIKRQSDTEYGVYASD